MLYKSKCTEFMFSDFNNPTASEEKKEPAECKHYQNTLHEMQWEKRTLFSIFLAPKNPLSEMDDHTSFNK